MEFLIDFLDLLFKLWKCTPLGVLLCWCYANLDGAQGPQRKPIHSETAQCQDSLILPPMEYFLTQNFILLTSTTLPSQPSSRHLRLNIAATQTNLSLNTWNENLKI